MSDKLNKKKKILPKTPSRGNFQIWLIISLLLLVIGITYFNKNANIKSINRKKFEEMVLSHDVEKVVLIKNQNVVEVTLKKEALENKKYKRDFEERTFSFTDGPHYRLNVPSIEVFDKWFEELKKKLPPDERFDYEPTDKSNLTDVIFQYGFIILLIFGF